MTRLPSFADKCWLHHAVLRRVAKWITFDMSKVLLKAEFEDRLLLRESLYRYVCIVNHEGRCLEVEYDAVVAN